MCKRALLHIPLGRCGEAVRGGEARARESTCEREREHARTRARKQKSPRTHTLKNVWAQSYVAKKRESLRVSARESEAVHEPSYTYLWENAGTGLRSGDARARGGGSARERANKRAVLHIPSGNCGAQSCAAEKREHEQLEGERAREVKSPLTRTFRKLWAQSCAAERRSSGLVARQLW